MYRIKCDGYDLYDERDDSFIVQKPTLDLGVNKVGGGSFVIHKNHPYYGKLKKLRSVFEVSDEIGVVFRGRMTGNSYDWNNSTDVDLEGALAYFNDSIVRPYRFPEDFLSGPEYISAAESGNVVAYYLGFLINQHNEQVEPFQRFKLGRVTVADPNNYITRSDSSYPKTWAVLKSKLFESALGGYLCIRYEADGNYIDYLREFELTNTQPIEYGKNLLSISRDSDATETYSAIIPRGATLDIEREAGEGGGTETESVTINITGLPDGDITDDIVKDGDMIYSRKAVEEYGLIIAPVEKTTWDDVTDANNLLQKSAAFLASEAVMLTDSAEFTAADLHFSDAEIRSFRIYRNVKVFSPPHGMDGVYPLLNLKPDLQNPQNTKITVGATKRTLTDINSERESETIERVEQAERDIAESREQTTSVKNQLLTTATQIMNDCERIILSALESYVETSDYEEFRQTVSAQLELLAGEMTVKISEATQMIENVNGDLQEKFNTITKYFTFDINGLTIGAVGNPNKVVIDNDEISILVNGVVVQKFDANGKALIPELIVTKAMNLLGMVIESDETHINCEFVEGSGLIG